MHAGFLKVSFEVTTLCVKVLIIIMIDAKYLLSLRGRPGPLYVSRHIQESYLLSVMLFTIN